MKGKNKEKIFSTSPSNKDYKVNLLPKNKNSNTPISKDSEEIHCLFVYNFFKITLGTVQKKLIFFLICITILVASLLVTRFVTPEFVIPDCSRICKKPYKIKVYSDKVLESQLKKCKYKKGTHLYDFALSAIKLHNIMRACHNALPLKFNCEVMKIAQNYSEYLANELNDMKHSTNRLSNGSSLGENLAGSGPKTSGEAPTYTWYSEIKRYNFSSTGVNHLTQIIWKGSREFGIGKGCNKTCYVTGNYFPSGNNFFRVKENVQNLR